METALKEAESIWVTLIPVFTVLGSGFIAILVSILTTYLTSKSSRSEKWWDKKLNLYEDAITHINSIINHQTKALKYLNENNFEKFSKEFDLSDTEAKKLLKITQLNTFYFSTKVEELTLKAENELKDLLISSRETMDVRDGKVTIDEGNQMIKEHQKIMSTLKINLIKYGKKDLKLK